jgi:adenylate kinase
LKTQDYEEEKVLVLISSVVTWVNTPPNRKAPKDGDITDTESDAGHQVEIDNSGLNDKGEMVYPFDESDLEKRVPSPKYQSFKTLENIALAAMKIKDNLKVYVLCSGVVYGNGEEILYTHFKQAWLQKQLSIPIIGKGDNIIPTIHVKDLANMVKRIAEVKPPHHYCFAIDRSLNQTQEDIVKSISNGIGSGQTHHIELDDVVYEDWAEFLTLNIRLKSSSAFYELTLDNPDQEESKEFIWHSEKGLRENIRKVNEEFNSFHGLKQMKICVNGPPASGKSYYSNKLSQMYGIPHIKITDVIELASTYEGESGDEIRKFIDSKRDETMEEFEKSKKKGQELTRDEIVVRLPDHHLHALTKIKISENCSRNKGFILDGFPKSYVDCHHAFYSKIIKLDENGKEIVEKKVKPEGEGDQEPPASEEAKPIDWENDYEVDASILPKIFIQLTGAPEEIKARVKELPEDKTAGLHWDDAGLDRRNVVYNKQNTRAEEGEEDKKLLADFFTEHNVITINQN